MFISKSLRAELNKTHSSHVSVAFDTIGLTGHHSPATTLTSASMSPQALLSADGVFDLLLSKIPTLHHLSALHMDALSKFKGNHNIEFPDLHRELFSLDIAE